MTSKPITIPKMLVRVLLASFYAIGFIITPYWRSAESTSDMSLLLALIVFVGAVWLAVSGSDLQVRVEPIPSRWGFLLILLVVFILLNVKPLGSVLPWRGDEDYHVSNTLVLASTVSTKWLLAFFVALCLLIYTAWRKSRLVIPLGMLFLSGVILFIWSENPFAEIKDAVLFRYPYLNYWFFALLPKLALVLRAGPYHEVLFRILPFMAGFALVWVCQMYFVRPDKPLDLLWGGAVATMPLVFYYSSILYLELPAVVLMTFVCMNIQNLLQEDFLKIKQNPAWYALILLGFIKETTTLFLLCFAGWRLIAFLVKSRIAPAKVASLGHDLIQEVKVALATLLPALLYLFLRTSQTRNRSFSPDIMNLANPGVLHAIGQSLVDQMGIFLILFLAGSLLLLLKKQFLAFGFLSSLFLVYPLFFASDAVGYAGYSRFNLYILPPVLAASGVIVRELADKKKAFGILLAGALIGVNVWMSPINLDGTKEPFWGNYMADTSEHYYPYREALEWLKTNHGNDRILFTGMHYPYISFAFYFSKFGWEPDHEIVLTEKTEDQNAAITQALRQAEAENFDVVLYQVTGNETPQNVVHGDFVEEVIFLNDAHRLIVYSRK